MIQQLWVIAGPNGAGKSTLVAKHLAGNLPIVNPDEIAYRIDPSRRDERSVQLAAGREAVRERTGLIRAGRSFAMETTLTGSSTLSVMRLARQQGFKITLVYVGLDDARQALLRVQQRVSTGGHRVPPDDVLRRFRSSLDQLPVAAALSDRVILLDNSTGKRRLILHQEPGRIGYRSNRVPRWAAAIVP